MYSNAEQVAVASPRSELLLSGMWRFRGNVPVASRQLVAVRMGLTPAREHYQPQLRLKALLDAVNGVARGLSFGCASACE
jgi:hypothetical protein